MTHKKIRIHFQYKVSDFFMKKFEIEEKREIATNKNCLKKNCKKNLYMTILDWSFN